MFGYGTPKQRLWEALEEHAEEVGKTQAIADLGDILSYFANYGREDIGSFKDGYEAAMKKVHELSKDPQP